jgi:hypothetical protein
MPVEISGLDETLTAIDFVTQVVERGTGATAIEKGSGEQKEQTLGEVQILVGKAMDRIATITKFYRNSWYETSKKWDAMMQANNFKKIRLYKTGKSGKIYEKVVYNSDWKSEAGYEPTVVSASEQEQEQAKTMQKFLFVQAQFPNNQALRKIAQKRELKLLDLSPDELKMVEDAQLEADTMETQQKQAAIAQGQAQPEEQQMVQQLQNKLQEINGQAITGTT